MSDEQIDAAHSSTEEIDDTESEPLRKLIREIHKTRKCLGHSDSKDLSYAPSYTRFKVPYFMVCSNRYRDARQRYNRQFRHEIQQMINQMWSAFEVAQIMRHTSITTLWPPYHTRKEIDHSHRFFHCLTQKEQNRLKFLMTTNII